MEKNIFIQSIDEFNYTSSVNFFEEEYKPASVICLPGFEILFYNFNKIIVSKLKNTEGLLLSSDINLKAQIFEDLKKEALLLKDTFFDQSNLDTKGAHIYKFMFSSLAKDMLIKSHELYMPKEKDYFDIKTKLSYIDKKIITINGRNLKGDRAGRNDFLFNLISFLISKNYFVVNCTMPNTGLVSTFNSDSYIEIDEKELFDYSKNISYFLNSNCLISVSNSAGITNHICTKSNIILYGPGGWVDNPEFGYENQSLYDISKKIKPTYLSNDLKQIDLILKTLEKPKDVLFFNESKIVNS